jgi:hypothetical protein
VGAGLQSFCFWSKVQGKRGSEVMRCRDATIYFSVAKVMGEVFFFKFLPRKLV